MSHRSGTVGYRTVFYRELPDSSGHCWNVPVWSAIISDAGSHEEALEKALRRFEEAHGCKHWSYVATLVEIDEHLSATDEEANPPRAKRILVAPH